MYANFYAGENNSEMDTNGELRAMRRLLPRCALAFDVGANVGEWAAHALRINPALRVHCFEPASGTFAALTSAAAGLPADRVTFNQLGLSDRPSEAVLHLHADVSQVNTLHPGMAEQVAAETGTETIRLDTLDRYCAERGVSEIDYLKVDVEGHELAVLRGAAGLLGRRAVRFVQLEYSSAYAAAGARFGDVFRLLQAAGYTCHKILPGRLLATPTYRPDLDNWQLSNWVFARPGETP
jgi:FkbM family methyltransferase